MVRTSERKVKPVQYKDYIEPDSEEDEEEYQEKGKYFDGRIHHTPNSKPPQRVPQPWVPPTKTSTYPPTRRAAEYFSRPESLAIFQFILSQIRSQNPKRKGRVAKRRVEISSLDIWERCKKAVGGTRDAQCYKTHFFHFARKLHEYEELSLLDRADLCYSLDIRVDKSMRQKFVDSFEVEFDDSGRITGSLLLHHWDLVHPDSEPEDDSPNIDKNWARFTEYDDGLMWQFIVDDVNNENVRDVYTKNVWEEFKKKNKTYAKIGRAAETYRGRYTKILLPNLHRMPFHVTTKASLYFHLGYAVPMEYRQTLITETGVKLDEEGIVVEYPRCPNHITLDRQDSFSIIGTTSTNKFSTLKHPTTWADNVPYTVEEDKTIWQYILWRSRSNGRNQRIREKMSGWIFWKQFIEDCQLKRTWQSLSEHFVEDLRENIMDLNFSLKTKMELYYALSRVVEADVLTEFEKIASVVLNKGGSIRFAAGDNFLIGRKECLSNGMPATDYDNNYAIRQIMPKLNNQNILNFMERIAIDEEKKQLERRLAFDKLPNSAKFPYMPKPARPRGPRKRKQLANKNSEDLPKRPKASHVLNADPLPNEPSTSNSLSEPKKESSSPLTLVEPKEEPTISVSLAEPKTEPSSSVPLAEPKTEPSSSVSMKEPKEEPSNSVPLNEPKAEPLVPIPPSKIREEPVFKLKPMYGPINRKPSPKVLTSLAPRTSLRRAEWSNPVVKLLPEHKKPTENESILSAVLALTPPQNNIVRKMIPRHVPYIPHGDYVPKNRKLYPMSSSQEEAVAKRSKAPKKASTAANANLPYSKARMVGLDEPNDSEPVNSDTVKKEEDVVPAVIHAAPTNGGKVVRKSARLSTKSTNRQVPAIALDPDRLRPAQLFLKEIKEKAVDTTPVKDAVPTAPVVAKNSIPACKVDAPTPTKSTRTRSQNFRTLVESQLMAANARPVEETMKMVQEEKKPENLLAEQQPEKEVKKEAIDEGYEHQSDLIEKKPEIASTPTTEEVPSPPRGVTYRSTHPQVYKPKRSVLPARPDVPPPYLGRWPQTIYPSNHEPTIPVEVKRNGLPTVREYVENVRQQKEREGQVKMPLVDSSVETPSEDPLVTLKADPNAQNSVCSQLSVVSKVKLPKANKSELLCSGIEKEKDKEKQQVLALPDADKVKQEVLEQDEDVKPDKSLLNADGSGPSTSTGGPTSVKPAVVLAKKMPAIIQEQQSTPPKYFDHGAYRRLRYSAQNADKGADDAFREMEVHLKTFTKQLEASKSTMTDIQRDQCIQSLMDMSRSMRRGSREALTKKKAAPYVYNQKNKQT